jgi:DNA gyrase subunit A
VTDSAEDRLRSLREREHVLVAIVHAQQGWTEVLRVVSESNDADQALEVLKDTLGFDDVQAIAILDVQFRRVSRVGRQRVEQELDEVRRQLSSPD